MKTAHNGDDISTIAQEFSSLTGVHRRTLEAIFRHPSAHNLEWSDVVGLIGQIGAAHEKSNNEFLFEVSGEHHLMRKPHTKDLTSSDVINLRRFLEQAGVSPGVPSGPVTHPDPAAPSLLIVVDHHETKIFHIDVTSGDASEHMIKPYDPHHFLHHLTHKDQSRERGQRAPEEPAYYEKIAEAVALGGKLIIVGHGTGKSNAARHLIEYLQTHQRETYQRVVREIEADLSSITPPQLLELARQALSSPVMEQFAT